MSEKTICFSRFRQGADDTAAFAAAMAYLREHPGTTLVVEPGVYTLTSDLARTTRRAVLNGDYSPNPERTMFNPRFAYTRGISFEGQRDTRMVGYGATLLVDGFMEPLSLVDCENVEVAGIVIDHTRKPYSFGEITAVTRSAEKEDEAVLDVTFDASTPITAGTPLRLRAICYDLAQNKHVYIDRMRGHEVLDAHHAKIHVGGDLSVFRPGMQYYSIHTYHFRPAILIEYAKNITLTDVTIHSQPGMGVVGNRSEDILLRGLAVVPSCGHHFSTNTDATHFTSVKGKLRLENCRFDSQGDDFVNIHGYYQAIVGREGDCVCYMQEKTPAGTHAQSLDYPDVGDRLELTDLRTLAVLDTYRVTACEPMPDEWMCRVSLDHPLPADTERLALADVTRLPYAEIVGCTALSHYARGILLKTRGALIEGNFFHDIQGPAIEVAAEAWWYEGVCPANVTVRRNYISNCGCHRGPDATGGVLVMADADEARGQSIFDIVIEDNIIDCPNAAHGIYVRNTNRLTLARNRIHCQKEPAVILDCTNVKEG